jgi:hypothetical protein
MFAVHGAKVLLSDSNSSLGRRVAEEIADGGGSAVFASQDVRDEAQWATIVAQAEKTYGRLDICTALTCPPSARAQRCPSGLSKPTSPGEQDCAIARRAGIIHSCGTAAWHFSAVRPFERIYTLADIS